MESDLTLWRRYSGGNKYQESSSTYKKITEYRWGIFAFESSTTTILQHEATLKQEWMNFQNTLLTTTDYVSIEDEYNDWSDNSQNSSNSSLNTTNSSSENQTNNSTNSTNLTNETDK